MLHIIFMIFKIIGIVLLIALAVVFFLLFCILFIPIRYKVQGSYYGKAEGMVRVSWFFHLLSIKAWYMDESNVRVRILGIPVYDAKHREEKQKRSTRKQRNKNIHHSESNKEETETLREEPESIEESVNPTSTKKTVNEDHVPDKKENVGRKKYSIKEKITQLIHKIKKFIHNIKYTIKRICDKIKQIYENVQYYRELMQSNEMKSAFSLCKKQLYQVWRNIKPRRFQVYLHIGNEDPCITGEIMALYGMLYPFVGRQIQVVPEFEASILEANIKANGYITVFVLIKVFIRVYFDKNIRHLLQLLNKEDSHGR